MAEPHQDVTVVEDQERQHVPSGEHLQEETGQGTRVTQAGGAEPWGQPGGDAVCVCVYGRFLHSSLLQAVSIGWPTGCSDAPERRRTLLCDMVA